MTGKISKASIIRNELMKDINKNSKVVAALATSNPQYVNSIRFRMKTQMTKASSNPSVVEELEKQIISFQREAKSMEKALNVRNNLVVVAFFVSAVIAGLVFFTK